jgi:hypothetical protein
MGKKKKEHRKRVQQRNNEIKGAQKIYQKMYQDVMMKQIEAIRAEQEKRNESSSGDTSSTGITLNMG